MTSKEKILGAVKRNQPDATLLPDLKPLLEAAQATGAEDILERYITVLTGIGGVAYQISSYDEVAAILNTMVSQGRVVNTVAELHPHHDVHVFNDDIHSLDDVELAIMNAHFAVAENGAVWVTETLMGRRVFPFIAQHLAIVLPASQVVSTMHEAYARIGSASYGYGAFIAGPSKTADIEQSLVLGAHGARSLHVFLIST